MTDLWPQDFHFSPVTTPLTIMRQQAALLGKKTSNLVKAEVTTDGVVKRLPGQKATPDVLGYLLSPPLDRSFSEQNEFVFRFYVVAPTLGNYHYRLFTAGHSIDPYPVAMLLDTDIAEELAAAGFRIEEEHVLASSEEEFMKLLQFILGSRKTRQLIGVLMSQATGESGEGNS